MTEFGTDDPSNDASGYPTDLTEFIKTFRAQPENKDLNKPLLTYQKEDPWAFLQRIKKVTVTPNPHAIEEQIRECKDRELIDLWGERQMRSRGETPEVDSEAIEAFRKSELIDLYTQRKLEERMQRRL